MSAPHFGPLAHIFGQDTPLPINPPDPSNLWLQTCETRNQPAAQSMNDANTLRSPHPGSPANSPPWSPVGRFAQPIGQKAAGKTNHDNQGVSESRQPTALQHLYLSRPGQSLPPSPPTLDRFQALISAAADPRADTASPNTSWYTRSILTSPQSGTTVNLL
jgi:hypothetical protein